LSYVTILVTIDFASLLTEHCYECAFRKRVYQVAQFGLLKKSLKEISRERS